MIRRTLLLLLALFLVTGMVACGGGGDESDDDDTDDDATTTTEEEAEEGDATTTSTTAPPADGDAAPAPAPEGEGEGTPGDVGTELGIDRTFTGEGSDDFCAEVQAMQEAGQDDPTQVDDATAAARMADITPPAEIEPEWTSLHQVLAAAAAEPSGDPFADMSPDEAEAWGMAGAVVATYLGDVCGLAGVS